MRRDSRKPHGVPRIIRLSDKAEPNLEGFMGTKNPSTSKNPGRSFSRTSDWIPKTPVNGQVLVGSHTKYNIFPARWPNHYVSIFRSGIFGKATSIFTLRTSGSGAEQELPFIVSPSPVGMKNWPWQPGMIWCPDAAQAMY